MTLWELASQDIYHETYGYIFCKFFSYKTSFQYKFRLPIDTSNKDWTINATYYSDRIRPPADGRLSTLMTHSAIGSYVSHLREMLCLLYAVAAISSMFKHTVYGDHDVFHYILLHSIALYLSRTYDCVLYVILYKYVQNTE
jgi:hypothetical protein